MVNHKTIKIGFVFSEFQPFFTEDEKVLIELLGLHNIEYKCLIWDDENFISECKREKFDIIIIRSLWDYISKIEKFLDWVDNIKKNNIKIFNDIDAIKWNIDKNYLNELSKEHKINIIPSIYIRKNESSPIKAILDGIENSKHSGLFKKDEKYFVYKPTIDGNGISAYKFSLNDFKIKGKQEKNDKILRSLLLKSDIIVQPFISSVNDEGEISFVFFNGKYSHSVIKKPNNNDFRVQLIHGGTVEKNINPSPKEIEFAQNIINIITNKYGKLIYGRIDMLRIDGVPHLIESEIFEPILYFNGDKKLANKFINSIFEILNN